MNRYEFWIRLSQVKKIKKEQFRQLKIKKELSLTYLEHLFEKMQLTEAQRYAFFYHKSREVQQTLEWLEKQENQLITFDDNAYPELLKHICDPPLLLFIKGKKEHLRLPQIAMVGSRKCSFYGKQWGSFFAEELVKHQIAITSGLAIGIDTICHKAAIKEQGITLAVLGSGLSNITPKCQLPLVDEILRNDGILLSEYLPNDPAFPEHFPRRNRILSGLSLGTLIVEAAKKSGSLITARCALEQGREIFALPGPLGHDGYSGTHALIQQGANLVTHPMEIIAYLNSSLNWLPSLKNEEKYPILQTEQGEKTEYSKILAYIGDTPTPIDDISEKMGASIAEIALQLLELELSGHIRQVIGGYERVRKPI